MYLPILSGAVAHLVYRFCEPRKLYWHFVLLLLTPFLLATSIVPHRLLAGFRATLWLTYLASLVICTIAYRLSPLHPLAKYPGPLLCKVSKIFFAFKAFSGRQHRYRLKLHQLYGDIVRIGPNELSFCTPEFIAPMLGPGGMPKSAYWDGAFSDQPVYRTLVGIRDPEAHVRVRRMWTRGFTPEAIRSYHPFLYKRVGELLEHLGARTGQTVDLAKWMSWFSYDVMNDIGFGDDIEMMEHQDQLGIWKEIEDATPAGVFVSHLEWLGPFIQAIPGAANTIKSFKAFARRCVLKRLKAGATTKDLLYYLMDEGRVHPTPPVIEQVVSDSLLVILAGSDTISPALSSIFYFLICNPVVYARLQAEVEKVSWDDANALAQLPYLNAVLNETLRIIPPVLSGTSRAPRVGSGGFMLNSHFIPEGTTTGIHTLTMHRDARNFLLPDRFLPERWLPVEKQLELEPELFSDRGRVVHNLDAFTPFSYGPGDCIGKRFALHELRALTCAILQRFTLKFPESYNEASWEVDMLDFLLIKKPELPVIFTSRTV